MGNFGRVPLLHSVSDISDARINEVTARNSQRYCSVCKGLLVRSGEKGEAFVTAARG